MKRDTFPNSILVSTATIPDEPEGNNKSVPSTQ